MAIDFEMDIFNLEVEYMFMMLYILLHKSDIML